MKFESKLTAVTVIINIKEQRMQGTVCMPAHMKEYASAWLMDIMHGSESLSLRMHVLAEMHWPDENGPAEYQSLTIIQLPQASPAPADIRYLLMSPYTLP